MPFYSWIVLIHDIVGFIIASRLIKTSFSILSKKTYFTKITRISILLKIFFVFAFFAGTSLFIFSGYSVIFWRPEVSIYDAQWFYSLGLLWDTVLLLFYLLKFYFVLIE